jgi:hypothetical protein
LPEYDNPAKLFLATHRVESLADIFAYADFLRSESGVNATPPVDLFKIYSRFGLHLPVYAPLPQQQGLTIPCNGVPQIIINVADNPERQRFTQAHELMELLFSEFAGGFRLDRLKRSIFGNGKENICQVGAAHLLMPAETFEPKARCMGISFRTAEILATEFEVSFIAALFRLTDVFQNRSVIVLWRMKNKPSELQNEISSEQMVLSGFEFTGLPSPKLRVEWCYGTYHNHFIPDNKSAPKDSSVYLAWEDECYTIGEEIIPFPRYNHKGIIENKLVSINDERMLLSLIR